MILCDNVLYWKKIDLLEIPQFFVLFYQSFPYNSILIVPSLTERFSLFLACIFLDSGRVPV